MYACANDATLTATVLAAELGGASVGEAAPAYHCGDAACPLDPDHALWHGKEGVDTCKQQHNDACTYIGQGCDANLQLLGKVGWACLHCRM